MQNLLKIRVINVLKVKIRFHSLGEPEDFACDMKNFREAIQIPKEPRDCEKVKKSAHAGLWVNYSRVTRFMSRKANWDKSRQGTLRSQGRQETSQSQECNH